MFYVSYIYISLFHPVSLILFYIGFIAAACLNEVNELFRSTSFEEYAQTFHFKIPLMLSTLLNSINRRHQLVGETADVIVDEYNGLLLTLREAKFVKQAHQSMD